MALYKTDENGNLEKIAGYGNTNDFVKRDDVYPVGSIYLTVATDTTGAVSPASFVGGTWERLPDGYALWTASEGAGTTIDAGLPEIDAYAAVNMLSGGGGAYLTTSGAFSASASSISQKASGSGSSQALNRTEFAFYASDSNPIYGASNTVQPPAIKVYAWRRIS